MATVLIVDDSALMGRMLSDFFISIGHDVIGIAATGDEAMKLADEYIPEIITVDNILPDMSGLELVDLFKATGIEAKLMVVSALDNEELKNTMFKLGVSSYLVKPFDDLSLLKATQAMFATE